MVKVHQQMDIRDSSTDSSEGKTNSTTLSLCQHVKKSVDSTKLCKLLKTTGLQLECEKCPKLNAISSAKDSAELTSNFEYDNTLWLCLKCGTQLCGRLKNRHALLHYKTPHSDSHALTLNTRSFEVWCYECDNKIKPDSTKNLLECVQFVKGLAHKTAPTNVPSNANIDNKLTDTWETTKPLIHNKDTTLTTINSSVTENAAFSLSPPLPPPIPGIAKRINEVKISYNDYNIVPIVQRVDSVSGLPLQKSINTVDKLPRVRGLTNLGNTCFFNAVLQCLAQTPYLLEVLKESAQPGEEFTLPGGTFKFEHGKVVLPPIKGTLAAWGSLTSALANALEELQTGGGVFTPSKLFNKLCSKCPQFGGGDQHDSHELLRHLLESVRSEDLKRYQRVILQNLGYKDQNINLVSDEMKQKCKIYGTQAADRILRPDQVFRGFLVSTLTCQDCYNVNSRHEYFLDLSLPVSVEKSQPPQLRRKTSPENSNSNTFYLSNASTSGSIKAQLKKERKMKRAAKHQHTKLVQKQKLEELTGAAGDGIIDRSTEIGCGTREEATAANSAISSASISTEAESDADIEDNLVDENEKMQKRLNTICNKEDVLCDTNGNLLNNLPEKRNNKTISDNMEKDSLDEDENDSGIATSPAIPTNSFPHSSYSNSEELNANDENRITNSFLSLGLSEKGATIVKQLSLNENKITIAGNDTFLVNGETKSIASLGDDGNNDTIARTTTLFNQLNIDEDIKEQEYAEADIEARTKTQQKGSCTAQQLQPEQRKQKKTLRAKTRRVRTQSYSDWSTTIAPRYQCEDGECSVQSCLNNFTAVELMTGNNKVGCENCTKRLNGDNPKAKTVNTNATKQFLISSPPAVLILHLKRFQLGLRCVFRKLTRAVTFPILLDIAPFCGSKVKNLPNIDRKQKKLLYALYGVVEHSGGMYGGHYTAYVKVRPKFPKDDKRWKFLPQGSKAELDQDDEQRKKLEELLAKEKARDLRMRAANDSDDFSNSSVNTESTTTNTSTGSSTSEPEEDVTLMEQQQQELGAVGGYEEANDVQMPLAKWYHVSDSYVREVNESTVLGAQAYLLFYERIY